MIARLVVVAAGIVAAAAGAAAWTKRKAERAESSQEVAADMLAEDSASSSGSADLADAEDDLQAIKGIGGVSAERLSAIGVTTFAEIAEWSPERLEAVAAEIKISPERIRREDWVGQAGTLANG